MIPEDPITREQNPHFRVLGICWIIYGIFRLVAAAWLISFANNATMMFGSLLGRVSDPFTMMSVFHFFYSVVIVVSVICGILGIVAGLALLSGQKSGRTLALIAAFLSLPEVPLGITLGIYTLIVLLPLPATHASKVILHEQPPDLRSHPSTT